MITLVCGPVAAGKTTLARRLANDTPHSYFLDSDECHPFLPKVDFSVEGRLVHAANIAEYVKELLRVHQNIIGAFCLPLLAMRDIIREELNHYPLLFLWLDTPLHACIRRDPKGLYLTMTPNLPGVDFPLEPPKPYEALTVVSSSGYSPP